MYDILGPDNPYSWAVEKDRVIIWIELQFIDPSLEEEPQKTKSKVNSSTPSNSRTKAPAAASNKVKSEPKTPPREPINLAAFQQDPVQNTDPETAQSSPAQADHEDPLSADEDEAAEEAEAQDTVDENQEEQSVSQHSRKRPRSPTNNSETELLQPRRSRREIRPTSKAQPSRS